MDNPKLKIWTDKTLVTPASGWVFLLYPLWGEIPEPEGSPDAGRFNRYLSMGKDFFEQAASMEEADVLLCPISYEMPGGKETAARFNHLARRAGKQFLLFFNHDSDERLDYDRAVIFRTSFYASRRQPGEHAQPGWSQDYIRAYYDGQLQVRTKRPEPVVGYCGYTGNLKKTVDLRLAFLRGKLPIRHFYDFQSLRRRCVRHLQKNVRIKTNFIFRSGFWGGKVYARELRREFVDNLIQSDYILVTRGLGNFSYRLYEALCCGRIPLFVNTDAPLPFDHIIDYRKYFVWIEDRDVKHIGDMLLDFHSSMRADEFIGRQRELRKLYEDWLSPEGFFKNLRHCLDSSLKRI